MLLLVQSKIKFLFSFSSLIGVSIDQKEVNTSVFKNTFLRILKKMCFVEAHDLTKTKNVKVNEEFF